MAVVDSDTCARVITRGVPDIGLPTSEFDPERWFIVLAAVAVLASGAIVGGFHPWTRDPGRQAGPTDAGRVFQRECEAQAKLTLPPGSDWPSRSVPANSVIPTGRGGMGESMAVLLAIGSWSCFAVDEHAAGREAASRAAAQTVVTLVGHSSCPPAHLRTAPHRK